MGVRLACPHTPLLACVSVPHCNTCNMSRNLLAQLYNIRRAASLGQTRLPPTPILLPLPCSGPEWDPRPPCPFLESPRSLPFPMAAIAQWLLTTYRWSSLGRTTHRHETTQLGNGQVLGGGIQRILCLARLSPHGLCGALPDERSTAVWAITRQRLKLSLHDATA